MLLQFSYLVVQTILVIKTILVTRTILVIQLSMNNQQNHISLKLSVHVQALKVLPSNLDTLGLRHICLWLKLHGSGLHFQTVGYTLQDTAAVYKLWLHQRYLRHADSCNSTSPAFHTASSDTNGLEGCKQGCSTGTLGRYLVTWL